MNTTSLILALLIGLAAAARAAEIPMESYSLDEAVRTASRNHAGLQAAEQDITIARQRVKEARTQFLPDIGLQAMATRFDSNRAFALRPGFGSTLLFPSREDNFFSGQAYMNFSLYEGRRHINTLRLAQTVLKQARSKFQAVRLDVAYEAKTVFYRLILAQEIARSAAELRASVERFQGKGAGALEHAALAAELRAADAKAGHALEHARLDFLKGLNRELDTPVQVEGSLESRPIDVDLRRMLIWATELRPELQSQTYSAQMDAISVNLALGRRTPTVVLGLDYEVVSHKLRLRDDNWLNNWDATIGVRLPFSFGFWPRLKKKVAEQRQGEIRRAELRDRVQLEVRKAYQDLMFWQAEWPEREKEARGLRGLLDAAARQGSAPLAVLRASKSVLEAQRRYLEAVAEHILARARLERAVGRPIPDVP